MYALLKKRRDIALKNLRRAFGGKRSEAELARICRGSFRNLGQTALEFLRFPLLTFDNIWDEVTVTGREHLLQALSGGKGAVVFLPHMGNWELLAPVYGALIPHQARAIAFPLKNPYLDALVCAYRERLSLRLIYRKQAVRETLRALRANYAVGFFADQNAGREGVFVDFFGEPASAVRGPVALSLKTGAPILLSLAIRQPDDRHRVIICPPVPLQVSGDFDHDVAVNTQRILAQLEDYINAHPEQWLWMHDRWKTRPDSAWQQKRQAQRRQHAGIERTE